MAPPAVTFGVASPVSTNEDTALPLGSLNVTFVDAGIDTITATLKVVDGTLTVGPEAGVTESGSGTVASPLILSGTLTQIDAALANGVTYTPNANFESNDTLSFSAIDGSSLPTTAR